MHLWRGGKEAIHSNRALHRRLKKARTTTELAEILKAFDQTMPA